jgi:hypothetical protein
MDQRSFLQLAFPLPPPRARQPLWPSQSHCFHFAGQRRWRVGDTALAQVALDDQ